MDRVRPDTGGPRGGRATSARRCSGNAWLDGGTRQRRRPRLVPGETWATACNAPSRVWRV